VEVQSESDRQGEHPAHAWLTALLAIMVDPGASYEIVGVLRETFGVSDDELARFAQSDRYKFQIERKTAGRGVVVDTLNLLRRIRETLPHQPLFSAVRESVRMSQLRERLRTLPCEQFGDSVNELEKLLSAAAAAEARQESLADFALALRRNFDETRETEPAEADAVQLITAHKAKGSEWDAVIVPFLAREARLAGNIRYPLVIPGEQPFIAFDRSDRADLEEEMKKIQRQEMERLLYVAMTRARHTLVLALDADFFRGKRGVHSDTQLKWLQADMNERNAEVISNLPNEGTACEQTATRFKQCAPDLVSDTLHALPLETGSVDIAQQRAASIIRVITPSQFVPEQEPGETASTKEWIEIEPELRPARVDNPATRYGLWWHEFAQEIPWKSQPEAWQAAFDKSVATSPEPARSRREWKLLSQFVSEHRDFLAANVFVETPFFWRMPARRSLGAGGNANQCLEGIIDLALFRPGEKEWFLLDWKTNRIRPLPDEIDKLRGDYRPQIAAYWKAVTEMTKQQVGAGIFSTATGQLVIYDQTELTKEWERLRNVAAIEAIFSSGVRRG
jgi:ATP-dependent exoDNAse (exonuclease V) beta subunit